MTTVILLSRVITVCVFIVKRGRVGQFRCSLNNNNGTISGLVLCICMSLHCVIES